MTRTGRDVVLWGLIAVFALFSVIKTTSLSTVLGPFIPAVSILVPTLFAVLHGPRRLGWRDFAVFFALTFAISWSYESLSIATGFPFGHYSYSDELGPKLGTVPLLIMPAYFAAGYLSWQLAHVLLDRMAGPGGRMPRWAVPVIAAFVMVMWDMSMDPQRSTLRQAWIWEAGGGYFGVPFSNFMGWYLCVVTIFLVFGACHGPMAQGRQSADAGRRESWHQVTALYGAIFAEFVAAAWFGPAAVLTDLGGRVWSARDMFETLGLVAIFTMGFVTVLALIKVQASDDLA
jgi:uncharacterized membrane protein